jgi:acetyl-CoA carboxylase biotin carboxyl carrier protein
MATSSRQSLAPFTGHRHPTNLPFVSEGTQVDAGQTLAVVEVMKTLCNIPAEKAGTVHRILVANGAAVEAGQRLFEIS